MYNSLKWLGRIAVLSAIATSTTIALRNGNEVGVLVLVFSIMVGLLLEMIHNTVGMASQ